MSNGKVYIFGCSHSAGHELGHKRNYKAFMEARGFDSVEQAINKLSFSEYDRKISRPWYKRINNICTPSKSWAGQIAQKLDMQIVNFAVPGSAFDFQITLLMEQIDNIDWNKDLVLFGTPVSHRYSVKPGVSLQSVQLNYLYNGIPPINIRSLAQILPSDETMLLHHYGLLTYLKQRYPKVVICEMTAPHENVENKIFRIEDQFYVEESLGDFSNRFEDCLYPGKHYQEHIHEKYAEYVLEKLTNDEKYSTIVT